MSLPSNTTDKYTKNSKVIVHCLSNYDLCIPKKEIKSPWIKCLWCSYCDKIEFDMSLHFLENHRYKLLQIPIRPRDRKKTKSLLEPNFRFYSRFEPPIEFRLDVAVEMAKRRRGVKDAIRSIQKQILSRRAKREGVNG
jgi:hypothetical protein